MRVLKLLVIAGATAIASSAFATPVVNTWSYNVTSFFTSCTFTNGAASPPDSTCTPTATTWGTQGSGTNGQQSSLVITGNPATGSVNTSDGNPLAPPCFAGYTPCPAGSEIAPTQTFTHNNNPVYAPFLTQATITTTLTLTPLVPLGGPAFGPVSKDIHIAFAETPNAAPCADTTSPVPCNDIFVLLDSLNSFNFFYTNPGGTPDEYFVSIIANPFNPLTPLQVLTHAECQAAGAADGCIGFTTVEAQSNATQFAFFITTTPFSLVPEPGTLALFALGLVGLSLSLRRREI